MAYQSFGEYARLKQEKLTRDQADLQGTLSRVFNGCTFHFSGHIDDASALKTLVLQHGGSYSHFLHASTITHLVATQLSYSRYQKVNKSSKQQHVTPQWIHDCIAAHRLIPPSQHHQHQPTSRQSQQSPPATTSARTLTTWKEQNSSMAQDFVQRFYQNSRLHHLSLQKQQLLQQYSFTRDSASSTSSSQNHPDSALILHVDMDCFFVQVSCAAAGHPEWIHTRPCGVSHHSSPTKQPPTSTKPHGSSADVASCNYLARDRGVKNGMLAARALQLCPDLVLLPYEFEEYARATERMYQVFSQACALKPVSCDEAYLDLSDDVDFEQQEWVDGQRIPFDPTTAASVSATIPTQATPQDLAHWIQNKIYEQTGCVASIGMASTPFLARMATFHAKPGGIYSLLTRDSRRVQEWMCGFKVDQIPGIGYVSMAKLKQELTLGSDDTVGVASVLGASVHVLKRVLGDKLGGNLYDMIRGRDCGLVKFNGPTKSQWTRQQQGTIVPKLGVAPKSVSAEINWGIRFETYQQFQHFLTSLIDESLTRLNGRAFGQLNVKLRMRHPDAPLEPGKALGCGWCLPFTDSLTFLDPLVGQSDQQVELIKKRVGDLVKRVRAKWWTKHASELGGTTTGGDEMDMFLRDVRGMGISYHKLTDAPVRTVNSVLGVKPRTPKKRKWVDVKADEIDWEMVAGLPAALRNELTSVLSPQRQNQSRPPSNSTSMSSKSLVVVEPGYPLEWSPPAVLDISRLEDEVDIALRRGDVDVLYDIQKWLRSLHGADCKDLLQRIDEAIIY